MNSCNIFGNKKIQEMGNKHAKRWISKTKNQEQILLQRWTLHVLNHVKGH